MNYYDTLIEVAEDCPATEGLVPAARGGKAIPKRSRPKERETFSRKGHPHLRVSPLAKRYGWGVHNDGDGKLALVAVDSPRYQRLMKDPRTTKVKAFRSSRA